MIHRALPTPKPFSLDEQMDRADRINGTITDTLDIMQKLGGDVASSKTFAQSLPKTADDAQKKIANIRNYSTYQEAFPSQNTSTQLVYR